MCGTFAPARNPGRIGAMAGKPRTGTQVLEETRTDLAKPWKVIVHDDPINLMGYVTRVFMQVFGYPKPKAETHMLEVHRNGRSILWTGGREQAEVYAMKLRAAHLLTTLEPVEES